MRKRLLTAAAAAAMVVGLAGPAAASDCYPEEPPEEEPTPRAKCNAGRGNGFETTRANDCDPGNSFAHNRGGG